MMLLGDRVGQIICGDSRQWMDDYPSQDFDLVIGSPPYPEKGQRYGGGNPLHTSDWVDWMVGMTCSALDVCRNVVVWVVNGPVLSGEYLPACEGLVWKMCEAGVACERPVIWHKNSTPNRKDWFVNDWEYCLAFRPNESTRHWDWQSIGTPPKHKSGGRFRQRGKDGTRRMGGEYPQNPVTRPRDVIRVAVGGGHMGSDLAHENEAPYPERLVEPFIKALCPPGGRVLDPFAGSFTTCAVAERLGRDWVGIDIRQEQCDLGRRRIYGETGNIQKRL